MSLSLPFDLRKKYQPVPGSNKETEDDSDRIIPPFMTSRHDCSARPFLIFFCFAFVVPLVGLLGFFAGRYGAQGNPDYGDFSPPPGNIRRTLVYDSTFSNEPTNETEEAWMGLFPKGRGFVEHPTIAPEISAVAVFHSLHCLHAIHGGYYQALNSHPFSHKGHEGHGDHDDPSHMRHCFDYLRQSLMCAADTNIEPMNMELGGVTGWGYERQCRDYDAVVQWASQWRMGNATDID